MVQHLENKIVLVTRRTRLEELVARYNTVSQARFYIEHLGDDFSAYMAEHETYQASLREVERALQIFGRVQTIERGFLPNFVFGPSDVVVALGQDGLVANTMKYLDVNPLIGVNPDPGRFDGVLLPFVRQDLEKLMPSVMARRCRIQEVTMAKAQLNNGQVLYGVNDIFIGPKSHTSARYTIRLGERQERQSSSGIIVSTGLGSTGWLKSLLAGAAAISGNDERNQKTNRKMSWSDDHLVFTVREPFPSRATEASLVMGEIGPNSHLILASSMADNGVLFSDGIETDYLEFNAGISATISVAEKRGHLVV